MMKIAMKKDKQKRATLHREAGKASLGPFKLRPEVWVGAKQKNWGREGHGRVPVRGKGWNRFKKLKEGQFCLYHNFDTYILIFSNYFTYVKHNGYFVILYR